MCFKIFMDLYYHDTAYAGCDDSNICLYHFILSVSDHSNLNLRNIWKNPDNKWMYIRLYRLG